MSILSETFLFLKTVLFKPSKKDLYTTKLGVNCFFNNPALGSIDSQSKDISDSLGIEYIRVLLQWNDHVQPAKNSNLNLSFITDIINRVSSKTKLLIVIAGVPSWLYKEQSSLEDKHYQFVSFCHKVFNKFKNHPKIFGYQVGNEPNSAHFHDNIVLQFHDSPENYAKVLKRVYGVSKIEDHNKLIVSAATTSIVQQYPDTLKYNQRMVKNGIEGSCDVYGVHYYGDRDFVNLTRPGGALYFLQDVKKPIWITEIGEVSFKDHEEYARTTIPFLLDHLKGKLTRLFWYQYDGLGTTASFGLKGPSGISAFYNYLLDLRNRR